MATIEIADVLRQFGASYLDIYGERILPSHRRAIKDITACRTQAMGGHVYRCEDCGETFHVYHACRNRACPACHTRQIADWFEARTAELLPCPYYHVTITIPAGLRDAFRSNQSACYGMLMKAAAESVKTLCQDRRYMGAIPAILAVLHTWDSQMNYHPHVHLLVSGGGIQDDGVTWREAKHPYLVPVRALSRLVRGKLHALLKKRCSDLLPQISDEVWTKDWVAWCEHRGSGQSTVLDYLARYVHRIAITNGRIVAMDENTVTFRYKNRKKNSWHNCTLTGHEFMRRFLQHVLPKGLHKVRYYGLWHCTKRVWQQKARLVLGHEERNSKRDVCSILRDKALPEQQCAQPGAGDTSSNNPTCPHCGSDTTLHLGMLRPKPLSIQPRASPSNAA